MSHRTNTLRLARGNSARPFTGTALDVTLRACDRNVPDPVYRLAGTVRHRRPCKSTRDSTYDEGGGVSRRPGESRVRPMVFPSDTSRVRSLDNRSELSYAPRSNTHASNSSTKICRTLPRATRALALSSLFASPPVSVTKVRDNRIGLTYTLADSHPADRCPARYASMPDLHANTHACLIAEPLHTMPDLAQSWKKGSHACGGSCPLRTRRDLATSGASAARQHHTSSPL